MAGRIYTGVLNGPQGGPYRVTHNLDTWHVEVSIRGYVSGDELSVFEIPDSAYAWHPETENSVLIDTTIPATGDAPSRGRIVANGWTVVVKPLGDLPL